MKILSTMLAAATALASTSAAADELSYTASLNTTYHYGAGPWTTWYNIVLPKFDPSLGILKSVKFTATAHFTFDVYQDASAAVGGGAVFAYGDFNVFSTLYGGNSGTPEFYPVLGAGMGNHVLPSTAVLPGQIWSAHDEGTFSSSDTTSLPDNLALFIGLGSTSVEQYEEFWYTFEYDVAGGAPFGTITGLANYDYKLTYSYVQSVPEPASWAMFIIGFGAASAAFRSRRAFLPGGAI